MIELVLPAGVEAVEAFEDILDVPLFAEEEQVVVRAVDKRRREFTTARICARAALARLGVPAAPILPGPRGAPGWPAGVVGSLTHCAGYRAAVVARSVRIAAIGIDAEPHQPLPDGVLAAVAGPAEHRQLAELAERAPGVCWDRMLFSAKESVYKTWFPLTGQWLDFDQAEVSFDPAAGTFRAELLVPGPVLGPTRLTGFDGRWRAGDGFLLTAIVQQRLASIRESTLRIMVAGGRGNDESAL